MLDIGLHRLHNQQLIASHCQSPAEVVGWLGAMQAQEYALAKWALGLRLPGTTEADIEGAFAAGSILRTHVMRPTWHFVTPADIRWLVELTAPRVKQLNAYMNRQLELDDTLLGRSNAAIVQALQGGKHLTREELAGVLAEIGIQAKGQRLAYIVHQAELEALICSGARRGKQFTYALLAERAPNALKLTREEALVELVKRYFTSHGPALPQDFAWWSGLTVTDAKLGLEMAQPHLVEDVINGKSYWRAATLPTLGAEPPLAYLLPPYDEYGIAYQDRSIILAPQYKEVAQRPEFSGMTLVNRQVVGNWRRTINKKAVTIESAPYRPLSSAEKEAVEMAARRFGDFLGLPVVVVEI